MILWPVPARGQRTFPCKSFLLAGFSPAFQHLAALRQGACFLVFVLLRVFCWVCIGWGLFDLCD